MIGVPYLLRVWLCNTSSFCEDTEVKLYVNNGYSNLWRTRLYNNIPLRETTSPIDDQVTEETDARSRLLLRNNGSCALYWRRNTSWREACVLLHRSRLSCFSCVMGWSSTRHLRYSPPPHPHPCCCSRASRSPKRTNITISSSSTVSASSSSFGSWFRVKSRWI